MSTQPPTKAQEMIFGQEVDSAASDLLERFDWLGLPEGTQLANLQVELGDAIGKVLKEWL